MHDQPERQDEALSADLGWAVYQRVSSPIDGGGQPGFRIAPPMLSGYLGLIRAGWDGQIRVSFSGERDEFPGSEEYGEGRVEPVTLVDLAVQRDDSGGESRSRR